MKRTTTKIKRLDPLEQIMADQAALGMQDEGCPNQTLSEADSAIRGARARQLLHYRVSTRADVGNGGDQDRKAGC
jgi:hypothetical protein